MGKYLCTGILTLTLTAQVVASDLGGKADDEELRRALSLIMESNSEPGAIQGGFFWIEEDPFNNDNNASPRVEILERFQPHPLRQNKSNEEIGAQEIDLNFQIVEFNKLRHDFNESLKRLEKRRLEAMAKNPQEMPGFRDILLAAETALTYYICAARRNALNKVLKTIPGSTLLTLEKEEGIEKADLELEQQLSLLVENDYNVFEEWHPEHGTFTQIQDLLNQIHATHPAAFQETEPSIPDVAVQTITIKEPPMVESSPESSTDSPMFARALFNQDPDVVSLTAISGRIQILADRLDTEKDDANRKSIIEELKKAAMEMKSNPYYTDYMENNRRKTLNADELSKCAEEILRRRIQSSFLRLMNVDTSLDSQMSQSEDE